MNLEEMWERLAQHQPYADRRGYGAAWARMCEQRTEAAAKEAAAAAAAWARMCAERSEAAAEAAAWAAADAAEAAEAADAETAVYWVKRSEGEK